MAYEFVGKLYDEFELNKQYFTSARTITEADVVNFAGLSGDFSALHINEEYAKNSIYGTRIAYGALTYIISTGLVCQTGMFDGSYIGLLGCEMKFTNPVRFQDTITCVMTPVEKRLSRKPGCGIIRFHVETINQKNEVVADQYWTILMATDREHME